ncbi:MAG: VWA domain-containing protein [Bryobacterales bacterium]|nr:VWA domain-containing protein [Bryobacterales bacterium]
MRRSRLFTTFLAPLLLLGQQPAPPAPPQQPAEETGAQFTTTVREVLVPVTVIDEDGNYVDGLQPHQFHLFDNEKPQDIQVDVAFHPISIVVAVQANSAVESVLPKIQKIGGLLQPLVVGDQGEASVLAFDHRIQLLQEFTSNPEKITQAVAKIKPGSSSSRMIDAVNEAVRMLRNRPQNRRRVILLISETRDIASEGRARETLHAAQIANVSIYTVNMSRLFTTLTAKPQPPRPDPLPPAARPLPPNVPATPTAVMNTWGSHGSAANFVPLLVEIFRDIKAIFKSNPAEVFTKGTGGREFAFTTQRGLEEAISDIGREIHSQYLISYTPNNTEDGGFHEIKIAVAGRRDVKTINRPGYWLGPLK